MSTIPSMSGAVLAFFAAVWVIGFGYTLTPGENPRPTFFGAREVISGKTISLLESDLGAAYGPLPVGDRVLIVCFDGAQEMWCFKALGWPMPMHLLDLYSVFRVETAGMIPARNVSLYQALRHFGLLMDDTSVRTATRSCALHGDYPIGEAERVIAACHPDVMGTTRLFEQIGIPLFETDSFPRALLLGRYAKAVAAMQSIGVPLDVKLYRAFVAHGRAISCRLLDKLDQFSFWRDGAFSTDNFKEFLKQRQIAWPRTPTDLPQLDDDTFKVMALAYPELGSTRMLRKLLPLLRDLKLAVGIDGRNRCPLFPWGSDTGRNQPSGNRFIFNIASCLRGLIQPPPGRALAYLDWSRQEFGCAAYLSGDPAMIAAYESGDPYLAFGKQAGIVPPDATKATHPRERELCKMCSLAVQYGMGASGLALRLGIGRDEADELLRAHRRTYCRFWAWLEEIECIAQLQGMQSSPLGWSRRIAAPYNACSVCNFPMQSAGADMLRMACCFGIERGVMICAPVHDAVLIEASEDGIDHAVMVMRPAMAEASKLVLGALPLREEVRVVRHPDRLVAKAHLPLWEKMIGWLPEGST